MAHAACSELPSNVGSMSLCNKINVQFVNLVLICSAIHHFFHHDNSIQGEKGGKGGEHEKSTEAKMYFFIYLHIRKYPFFAGKAIYNTTLNPLRPNLLWFFTLYSKYLRPQYLNTFDPPTLFVAHAPQKKNNLLSYSFLLLYIKQ